MAGQEIIANGIDKERIGGQRSGRLALTGKKCRNTRQLRNLRPYSLANLGVLCPFPMGIGLGVFEIAIGCIGDKSHPKRGVAQVPANASPARGHSHAALTNHVYQRPASAMALSLVSG